MKYLLKLFFVILLPQKWRKTANAILARVYKLLSRTQTMP